MTGRSPPTRNRRSGGFSPKPGITAEVKQAWYISTNPFFDMGMTVQPFRLDEMKSAGNRKIYGGDSETLHMSAGIGLKLVVNDNFVLSAEWGKPLDRRDGNQGVYLNLNYIF